jgi:hypothetical protein
VLRGIDTALELLGWSLAAFFVVLLFAGAAGRGGG